MAWVAVCGGGHLWGCAGYYLCARRARAIVSVSARGLIKIDLPADATEAHAFGAMRRSYEAMVARERLEGKKRRCTTTRPNADHKAEFGPRISSADGNRFKVLWKQLVLVRMRAFSGDAMATMAHYLAVVMPRVWSQLLAAHAVRAGASGTSGSMTSSAE